MKIRALLPAAVTAAACVASLGASPATAPAGAMIAPTASAQTRPGIEWRACATDESPLSSSECSSVALPLDHADPVGGLIEVAVSRSRGEGASVALWYLDGGPGDAGTAAMGRLRALFPDRDLDIYTFDHRGAGGSSRLDCAAQQSPESEAGREIEASEWQACAESLSPERDHLAYLTATQAALDVRSLIELTREEGQRTIVFGASYGSYLANRYLQLAPTQPDGVVLDGIVPPDWTFAEFDSGLADTARRLMERCAEQPRCAAPFEGRPVAVAAALPGRFDSGHCAGLGIDGRTVRLILGNMLMAGPDVWPYVTALVYRLDRCWLRDQIATGELVARLFESGAAGVEPDSHSPVLQRHVALSELWPDPPPSVDDLEAAATGASMTTEVSSSFARTAAFWPTYDAPAEASTPAPYGGPLLMLHGGLDPTMPVERLQALRAHYAGPEQTFVLFPDAGHVAVKHSACARELFREFLANPKQALDLSCVEAPSTLDLGGPQPGAESLFGTSDHWGRRPAQLELMLWGAGAAGIALLALGGAWWVRRRRAGRA